MQPLSAGSDIGPIRQRIRRQALEEALGRAHVLLEQNGLMAEAQQVSHIRMLAMAQWRLGEAPTPGQISE